MRLQEVHRAYFMGIGGIGMSAIARLFLRQGKLVYGYDRTCTSFTRQLESEGMIIHYHDCPELIPTNLDLVVYTPAIPNDLAEFVSLKASGLPVLKRSQVLGLISKDMFTVAIAGTHGKTSITAMLSHILKQGNYSFTGFVGGILKNYNSNLITCGGGESIVVEADEYDKSFHTLTPDIVLISAIDADHLDIYGTLEQLRSDYEVFVERIKTNGILFLHHALPWHGKDIRTVSYGGESENKVLSCVTDRQGSTLEFQLGNERTGTFHFHIPGQHNIENALAAASIAKHMGMDVERIAAALSGFSGVVRRFDVRYASENLVYIDDYAHHPKELEAVILAAKEYYQGMKVVGIFQPHLFSRTRDLAEGFAQSLDLLDQAYLLDIYPARELPIEGVDSAMICRMMRRPASVISREGAIQLLPKLEHTVLMTLGAGDIDLLVEPLENAISGISGKARRVGS